MSGPDEKKDPQVIDTAEDGKVMSYAEYWQRFRSMPSGCTHSDCKLSHARGPHRDVLARPPGVRRLIRVDAGVKPLLQHLWKQGLHTYASCENKNGYIWLGFSWKNPGTASRFIDRLVQRNVDDKAFIRRILSQRGEPSAWKYLYRVYAAPRRPPVTCTGIDWWYSTRRSTKQSPCSVDIRFPHDDLNCVLETLAEVSKVR